MADTSEVNPPSARPATRRPHAEPRPQPRAAAESKHGLGRRFAVQLTGTGLANLADGIVQVALPLVALTLTRSPGHFGLLTAAIWLPWVILGIPAGVFIDRWDRRTTMAAALAARAALIAGVAALVLTDRLSIWWLIGFACAYGVTEVFADLAAQAQVPALVGREPARLKMANARILAVQQVTNNFLGAPIAGALVTLSVLWVLGAPMLVVVAAVAVIAVGLRGSYRAARPDDEAARSLGAELRQGIAIVLSHPVLRPLMIAAGLFNFAGTALSAVMVLWLVGDGSAAGFSPQVWSLVLLAFPIGALLGSWASERLPSHWSELRVLLLAWLVNAVFPLVILWWPTVAGVIVFFVVIGVAGVIGNVITGSLRPRMVEEHLLGRVGGAARVVGFGAMPLGALVGGKVAEVWGIPTVLVGVVVVSLLSTAVIALTVSQRTIDAHDLSRAVVVGE